ncbi:divergent polysaccharide deacetylase family protein [Rhizobiales bacterium RZME27]|uniref:Divergent polysaccharide deacetylase family protein n=1 Tax=Endobacterium cereale TaxID=2663029 RepID=A0A6A8A511_9HYPH|nr:divergent polysaccharide deacetylase family protein [Endobacterium cereale]MEB2845187.1 divergent polysaccharide deacetylase family protein [Endobacterium cereale]MQY45969.1 divergent polysaccharide deacetylase family protein [Endobacterium cereale]
MGTDLHAPLGRNNEARLRRSRRISVGVIFGLLVGAGVFGFSFYAMRPDPALQKTEVAKNNASPDVTSDERISTSPSAASKDLTRSGPNGGATIQRTQTDNGQVVTTYSPKQRDGNGPLIIEAQRVGQDERVAAIPNEDLIEDTSEGRLPIVGPDGLRPMEQYARPWSGARGTRIAIVVGGLGLSQTGTQNAIRTLPGEITLAFAATGNSLPRWMQEARRKGHEILVQLPMEPFDYPGSNPGASTLVTQANVKENIANLHEAMAKITNYTGVMNYLGGRFLSDADALEPVLRDIAGRGLLFIDDGSSAQSLTEKIAKPLQLPHAFADLTLDAQLDKLEILKKLDELERIAQRKGFAIGSASAFDESIEAIQQWVGEVNNRGIEIVGVSAVVNDPAHP